MYQTYNAAPEENAVPTFEDLAIDDTLSDLDRVRKYVYSHIALQRLVHVRMLADTAQAVGFTVVQANLLPLLDDLVGDPEFVVRQHLAGQFQKLAEVTASFLNQ
jgi:serine/threonine-protein phosphatase 4 regulatory subunit 1